jgi:hypothetical protein
VDFYFAAVGPRNQLRVATVRNPEPVVVSRSWKFKAHCGSSFLGTWEPISACHKMEENVCKNSNDSENAQKQFAGCVRVSGVRTPDNRIYMH